MDQKPTAIINIKPDEEKEILETKIEVAKRYYLTPKYMDWEGYFFNKRNKETYGNATASAAKAYDLDLNDPQAYNVASNQGSKNLRKSKNWRKEIWKKKYGTEEEFLSLYNNMMLARKDINMMYAIGRDLEIDLPEYQNIENPPSKPAGNLLQISASDVKIEFKGME